MKGKNYDINTSNCQQWLRVLLVDGLGVRPDLMPSGWTWGSESSYLTPLLLSIYASYFQLQICIPKYPQTLLSLPVRLPLAWYDKVWQAQRGETALGFFQNSIDILAAAKGVPRDALGFILYR